MNAHRLRHTFGHVAQANDMDAAETARLMGHSSPWLVQTLDGASAADERARAPYRRLRLGDRLQVAAPTFPAATVTSWHDPDSLRIECHVCGAFFGSHRERESECRTYLRIRYVPHRKQVDGIPAYHWTDREQTRRPMPLRVEPDKRESWEGMARDDPAERFSPDIGPLPRVYPPVHLWCLACDAPQRILRICEKC